MSQPRHWAAGFFGLVLLSLFSAEVKAQVSVGGFAGISHFNVDQRDQSSEIELSSKTGLAIGALLDFAFRDRMSFQFEPMFLHKGTVATVTGFGDVDVQASYLEIPVMIKFMFGTGRVQPYLTGGPSFGFLLSAKQKADFIPSEAEDIKDQSEKFEVALTAGGGVQFPLGATATKGFVQARYYLGLTDTHAGEEHHRSRGYMVTTGVSFPLGR